SGVTVFNPEKNTYRHYKNDPHDKTSLGSNNAWTIFKDSENKMWVGTYSAGLDLFNPETNSFIHYTTKEGISHNMINMLYEDAEQNLWICTNGGGLNLFDRKKQTFTSYMQRDHESSISNDVVYSLLEDSVGNFWVGTGAGLNYFNRKTKDFTHYYTKDGLPNETIFALQYDDSGNIWINTNHGVSKLNPETRTFHNYSIADGLQSHEFKQASLKSRSGKMYVGGINGFNEFVADSIKDIEYDPNLVITELQLFNKPVSVKVNDKDDSPLEAHINETKSITLTHEQSVFSFEFASLNYTSPGRKNYAFMLTGFDKDWNYIGTKRTATYTNLNPGKYTFKVKGQDNFGNWSDKTISLEVIITPPFWKTNWFKIVILLVLVGTATTVYRIRMGMINR